MIGPVSNIYVTPLQILRVLVNNIVAILDRLCYFQAKSLNWQRTRSSKLSPFRYHISHCLHIIGAKCEKYYDGKLSGVPCSLLISKMNGLTRGFFFSAAENYV